MAGMCWVNKNTHGNKKKHEKRCRDANTDNTFSLTNKHSHHKA